VSAEKVRELGVHRFFLRQGGLHAVVAKFFPDLTKAAEKVT